MAKLSASAIETLAELVDAGYPLLDALAALPRTSLGSRGRGRRFDLRLQQAVQGASVAAILADLGLHMGASSLASGIDNPAQLVRALRADAEARRAREEAEEGALKWIWPQVLFLLICISLAILLATVIVPSQIESLRSGLRPGDQLPTEIEAFYEVRARWVLRLLFALTLFGGYALIWAGLFARQGLLTGLHALRLYLPFLRGHALGGVRARLAGLIGRTQKSGVHIIVGLRSLAETERIPRFARELRLVADRLEAGDPIGVSFEGTTLDQPRFRELGELAGRGVMVEPALQLVERDQNAVAVRGLKRALISAGIILLMPVGVYTLRVLEVAMATGAVSEIKALEQDVDRLGEEIRGVFGQP